MLHRNFPKNKQKTQTKSQNIFGGVDEVFKKFLSPQKLTGILRKAKAFMRSRKCDPFSLMTAVASAAATPQHSDGQRNGFDVNTVHLIYNDLVSALGKPKLTAEAISFHLRKPEFTEVYKLSVEALFNSAKAFRPREQEVKDALSAVSKVVGKPIEDVLMHDGCYKTVSPKLAEVYKASRTAKQGGVTCAVQLGIQATYSLKNRSFVHCDLSSGTANEASFVQFKTNHLHLADAGYAGYYNFYSAQLQGAYLLTKGKANMAGSIVAAKLDGKDKKPRFFKGKKASELARHHKDQVLDIQVEVNLHQKYFQHLPKDQRPRTIVLRAIRFFEDGTANWLITNLPQEVPVNAIFSLFRLRWQIELAFKDLKSHNNFRGARTNSQALTETFVWASLFTSLAKRLVINIAEDMYGISLSLRKCNKIAAAACGGRPNWIKQLICNMFNRNRNGITMLDLVKMLGSNDDLHVSKVSAKNRRRTLGYHLCQITTVCSEVILSH